ncbi:hypothetical protein JXO59_14830, partial [candidate division KSB1 bacterium]|nr:hypothetical protein [candidate division KSB1 bacterium]
MNVRLRSWPMIIILGSLLVAAANVAAMDLMRPYDPVIVQGKHLPTFLSADTSRIFVYAYKNNAWSQIPFQIDEVDGGGYFATHNAHLDTTDEICFMAADMGDSAADNQWIPNYSSMLYQRYQVCATDTSETPA